MVVILLHSQLNPLFSQTLLRDWKLVTGVLKMGSIARRYCLITNIESVVFVKVLVTVV
jgi:hypothetical protein